MKIRVLDWDIVRGRTDVKNPRWFGFQRRLFSEPRFIQRLTPNIICAYAYACCMALDSEEGDCEIFEGHLKAFTGMTLGDFNDACEHLQALQLLRITNATRTDPVQVTDGSRQNSALALHSIAEHSKAAQDPASVPDAPPQTTYEFFDQPKKKREKKPKPQLSCEAIPELISIKEILENRKVPTILQQKWVKLYSVRAVCYGVQKADSWAVSKGEEKKNWGMFFNNWLIRDHEKNGPAGPFIADAKRSAEVQGSLRPQPEERKKTWFDQQYELKAKGLPNLLDGSQKNPEGGGQ